jgi:hypothetical protein
MMKAMLLIGVCLGWAWLASGSAGQAQPAGGAMIYVSPQGNDQWPGTQARPFKTLTRARDAVRALRPAGGGPVARPVTVVLRGGFYSLEAPLELGLADGGSEQCPVTWTAAPNEQPVISGGRIITGWTPHTGGLWKASLPEVAAGKWYFRDLFVQRPGQRHFERRYRPSRGLFVIAGLTDGPRRRENQPVNHRNSQREFYYHPGDLQPFANLQDVEVVVMHDWSSGRMTIEALDEKERTVRFTDFPHYRVGHWYPGGRNPYLVENIKEDLGQPGQWYLDRPRGMLYYRPLPGEDMRTLRVVAPRLERLLLVTGEAQGPGYVEHLTFRGLTFAHTNWRQAPHKYAEDFGRDCRQGFVDMPSALEWRWSRHCRVERCELANLGSYGVDLAEGCEANSVVGNRIYDCGTGAVKVGIVDANAKPPVVPVNNRVENNLISDTGVVHYSGHGIWGGYATATVVRHNEVRRTLYSPVAIGWSHGTNLTAVRENIIESNHIHDVMLLLDHGGALYTLGNQPGTVLRGNLVHDTHQTKLHGKVKRPDWTAGAFGFDDGSSGFIVEDNIVYNLPVPMELPLTSQADRHTIGKNYLGIKPGEPGFPAELAAKAGLEPAYRELARNFPPVSVPPVLILEMPTSLPPLRIREDFERLKVGASPVQGVARIETGGPAKGTDLIAVTDLTAATGKHSLLIQDAPGLSRNWLPHLYYTPGLESGWATVKFAVRVGAGAIMDHSWRGRATKRDFSVGPAFTLRDGGLFAGEEKLMDFPLDTWGRVEVRCRLGQPDPGIGREGLKDYGVWQLKVQLPGQPEKAFNPLKIADQEFANLNWVGFVSLATEKTQFFLDDLEIMNE